MRKFSHRVRLTLVLFSSALLAGNLSAQVRVTPSIGMGVAVPSSHLSGSTGTGLTASGGAALTFGSFPVSLLPEFSYTRFTDRIGKDSHRISGSLNVLLLVHDGRFMPFLTGGAGIHHLAQDNRSMLVNSGSLNAGRITTAWGSAPENALGLDAGGGVEFAMGSVHGRVEARYFHLQSLASHDLYHRPASYIPITLSYLFR